MVEKNDNYLREAYDHEQAMIDTAKELGFEEGMKQGIEQKQKEMIQTIHRNGMKVEEIAKVTNLPLEKVTQMLEEI